MNEWVSYCSKTQNYHNLFLRLLFQIATNDAVLQARQLESTFTLHSENGFIQDPSLGPAHIPMYPSTEDILLVYQTRVSWQYESASSSADKLASINMATTNMWWSDVVIYADSLITRPDSCLLDANFPENQPILCILHIFTLNSVASVLKSVTLLWL